MGEHNVISETAAGIKERLSSPYIVFFITAWIFHNWKLLIGLFSLKGSFASKVGVLEGYFNVYDLLFYPLLKSAGIFLLYIVVGVLFHFIYGAFKLALGKVDAALDKRDRYLVIENRKYSNAFYALIDNYYLRLLANSSETRLDHEIISMWFEQSNSDLNKEVFKLYEDEITRMRSTEDLNNVDHDLLESLREIGAIKYWGNTPYFTTKGLFFLFQMEKIK